MRDGKRAYSTCLMNSAKPRLLLAALHGFFRGRDLLLRLLDTDTRALPPVLAAEKIGLVYGGGGEGLMGRLARATLAAGGYVSGIIPSFLIPTVEAQLERGGPVGCAALALAGWARYLATVPAAERAPDPHGDEATALATASLEEPTAFLIIREMFR